MLRHDPFDYAAVSQADRRFEKEIKKDRIALKMVERTKKELGEGMNEC